MPGVRFVKLLALAALGFGCAVRAPPPIDVATLLAKHGPVEAHRALEIRVLADPRDVQARLAIAALDDQLGRPGEALDELEAVQRLGGPIGTRWHAADRARLARLLVDRGRARLVRGAATALDDLTRAQQLGATVPARELAAARAAAALVELRHVDAEERAKARATLSSLGDPLGEPGEAASAGERRIWAGAKAGASPAQRAAFGAWAWWHGARREAYEQLAAWHAATKPPRDELYETMYMRAFAWWSPAWLADATPPKDEDLVGPERCRFTCDVLVAVGDPDAEAAFLASPIDTRTVDAPSANAIAAITLRAALRGEGGWGRLLIGRVDVDRLPNPTRAVFSRLVGRREPGPSDAELAAASAAERFVAAAERALAGGSVATVRAALGAAAATDDGRALLAVAAPATPYLGVIARADAVARFARARAIGLVVGRGLPAEPGATMRDDALGAAGVPAERALHEIAVAFGRDPSVAARLGRELIAKSSDGALAHATVGAAFDALGDPARARAEWQAASEASDEPALVAGFAEACARTGDGDAALIAATKAAAASGDPAVVWIAVARALLETHRVVDALTASRFAIDLAGPAVIAEALDTAIAASKLAQRDLQAGVLAIRRARVAPPSANPRASDDPTDAVAAREALSQLATAFTVARAWVASRWNPRDVDVRDALLEAIAPDDPRRGALVAELVALAGDPDHARGLAATLALRDP